MSPSQFEHPLELLGKPGRCRRREQGVGAGRKEDETESVMNKYSSSLHINQTALLFKEMACPFRFFLSGI